MGIVIRFPPISDVEENMALPLIFLNQHGPSPDEFDFLDNMAAYPPRTTFKTGDLALLRRKYLEEDTITSHVTPRMWQVRFVVSRYQYEMHQIIQRHPGVGFDHAHDHLGIPEKKYRDAVIYAHAFPHGIYPNSCRWFGYRELKRMMLRAPTEEWAPILDEFETPFLGYNDGGIGTSFHFDLAPDRYDIAQNKQSPLSFEEDTFHSACMFGFEKMMVAPREVAFHRRETDRDTGLLLP